MATLESPLEALAFEYASFGVFAVVNNVWTWIAVVTAAVSFWRIRVTTIGDGDGHHACVLLEELSGSMSEHDGSRRLEPKSSRTGPVKETVAKTLQSRTNTVDDRVKETVTKTEPLVWDEDGVTKGEKLTMYYEVDFDVEVDGVRCLDGELITAGGGLGYCGGEWWEKWERVMRMRNGDDGWYRYVDLTVINGNVVRLWDDSNRTSNGRRCLN
ncbi:hypothetical protein CARUB_v10003535mg [Capsella rubella]|uniref:Transmembrane protein n=1 Tax=Capsella rubella TaxID=81985 RepID=R0FK29_9BRAS|nr:uncharacterized protein LOC17883531 [Capsella rubella]EOA22817.1 hypothetical protein CARUB_v10003535mg [Capsella rubella]